MNPHPSKTLENKFVLSMILTADEKITDNNGVMAELKVRLKKFGIEHTTIQFECEACGQGRNLSVASPANPQPIIVLL